MWFHTIWSNVVFHWCWLIVSVIFQGCRKATQDKTGMWIPVIRTRRISPESSTIKTNMKPCEKELCSPGTVQTPVPPIKYPGWFTMRQRARSHYMWQYRETMLGTPVLKSVQTKMKLLTDPSFLAETNLMLLNSTRNDKWNIVILLKIVQLLIQINRIMLTLGKFQRLHIYF